MARRVDHEAMMRLALAEAVKARGRTRPNPMVGAVVAKSGRVIATGFHARAGLPHAEVVALRKAGPAARGADLYVSLEPCDHHGRTPPCTETIIAAGVRRVFAGMRDPNPLVDGRGLKRLRAAGIEVEVGVLARECGAVNRAFIHFIRQRTPWVIAKVAQSLDGRVATRLGESKWITSDAARRQGRRLRGVADAVVVGIGTVLADDPALTSRARGVRDPIRVVVDTQARTPIEAQVVQLARTSAAPTWIAVGESAPTKRLESLAAAGCELLRLPERDGRVDLGALLAELGARELLSVLVEGGPRLVGAFVDARLIDEVHLFVAPLIIGGAEARGAVEALGAARLVDAMRVGELEVERLGGDVWLRGLVARA